MGTLSIYLDASFIVPLFVNDAFVARAERFIATNLDELIISDFAAAEFTSAVGIRVRTGRLSTIEAHNAFSNFDVWCQRLSIIIQICGDDVANAQILLRRLELKLRAPDAIHLAASRRLGSNIATFDEPMIQAARLLGVIVAEV